MSILLICGSIFLIAALARKISNPIEKLAQDAESIQKFDLKVDENTKPSAIREIGALQASLASARQNIGMFTHFVPKNLVKKMVQRNKPLKIGGMEKKLTLFFSDIADFTTISEKYSPDLLATHLSEYFEELTGILTKNDATIDKYIGDAIMAFWGAPTPDKNHYVKACRSALYITYHLHHLNKKWAEEKKNPLNTRIGLHYGDVIVGNIGSSDRMNYTVIGDNVNLAARLEGLNKLYDTNILISEDLYDVVKKHMITRVVDMVAVKGKEKSVKIYELLGEKKGDPILIPDQNTIDFANDFNKAFDFYINRNWKESLDIFKDLKHRFGDRKDINLYIKRCQTLLKFPPDKDWNGVFKLNEK